MTPTRPEAWAGVECSSLLVEGVPRDQLRETGHAERPADLDLLDDLGVRAVRYPVLWGRGGPEGETDWTWSDVRLEHLDRLGIEPVVGLLHHGFGPLDPFAPEYPEAFGAYARRVARRYPGVSTWLPVNEPLSTARFAALYGWWEPHRTDHASFIRLLVAQCLAQQAASREIRRLRPDARILVTEDAGATSGTAELAEVVRHVQERHWLSLDLLTGKVDAHHPLWDYLDAVPGIRPHLDRLRSDPEPPDVVGLNYYVTSDRYLDHRLELYPAHLHGGGGGQRFVDVESVRVPGALFQGFSGVIRRSWERYRLPVALTEVQLAGAPEDQVAWWAEAWAAARAALQEGIPVESVTAWAVFGSNDWDSVLRRQAGHLESGCLTGDRQGMPVPDGAKLSDAIAHTARTGTPPRSSPGWWRRPERLLYGPIEPGLSDAA